MQLYLFQQDVTYAKQGEDQRDRPPQAKNETDWLDMRPTHTVSLLPGKPYFSVASSFWSSFAPLVMKFGMSVHKSLSLFQPEAPPPFCDLSVSVA